MALLHLSRSRIVTKNDRSRNSFSSSFYNTPDSNTLPEATETTSNPIRVRQSILTSQNSLSSHQAIHNPSTSPTAVSSNSFLSAPLLKSVASSTALEEGAGTVPPSTFFVSDESNKNRDYYHSSSAAATTLDQDRRHPGQYSESILGSPATGEYSATPSTQTTQSRSPATYSLSPLMRTMRFFRGTSSASSATATMTPNTLTPQSHFGQGNHIPPSPPSTSPHQTGRHSASSQPGLPAAAPPAVSYRSNGVAVYHPPPSTLFRSHYMEPDAVYEDDENADDEGGDRSSGGSYLTRSAYDSSSRFPSTNTAGEEEMMASLQRLHEKHQQEDFEREGRDQGGLCDGVRDLNVEFHDEVVSTSQSPLDSRNAAEISQGVEGKKSEMYRDDLSTSAGGYTGSDFQSDLLEDIENSMLAEEFASRFPGSVFEQNSGHMSAHNLLRISSVGSDWDDEEEGRAEGEEES